MGFAAHHGDPFRAYSWHEHESNAKENEQDVALASHVPKSMDN